MIGQPSDGDAGTAWRDNARMQYRNCIFMDLGGQAVRFDDIDGDGAQGYGFNGTLTWPQTWNTDYTATSTVNAAEGTMPGDFNHPDTLYQTQTSGKLAEITDSVFYNNTAGNAYNQANARGVFDAENNNVMEPAASPITSIVREPQTVLPGSGLIMRAVTFLDPRPLNDALDAAATAPDDGFFTPADYRGGFAPGENWLAGWSAADAFGFVDEPSNEILVNEDITDVHDLDGEQHLQPADADLRPARRDADDRGRHGHRQHADRQRLAAASRSTRGAQIFVKGTADNPVIMTSTADVATWTGGDPKTGAWREAANEWGNLTIMGRGLHLGERARAGNIADAATPTTSPPMEGLIAAFPGDPKRALRRRQRRRRQRHRSPTSRSATAAG